MRWNRFKSHPLLWILPSLVFILFVIGYPLAWATGISFFNAELYTKNWKFIGLGNYIQLLHDPIFYQSVTKTLIFTATTFTCEFFFGLLLALLLSEELKGRGIMRTIIIIPMMLTPIVVGLLWKIMLNPGLGVVDFYITYLGFPPQPWFSSPFTSLFSIVLVNIWQWTPFTFLVLLAGISALPKEPFEAAKMDGAGPWHLFRYLTMPMLAPIILIVALLRIMEAFKIFDVVYVTTNGGPANSSLTISINAYKSAFLFWHIGYSAAYIQLIFIMLSIITFFFIRKAWPEVGA